METVVYLIRHSEVTPKSNIKNISMSDDFQTSNEKAFLSVSGEKKAKLMSQMPELQNIDAVYSSNYVRALETAKYIAQENNTIINIDERLNERKIGEIKNIESKEFHRLQTADFDYKLSNGESLNETKKRMIEAMKSILMFESEMRVAIVSHSTALTCLLSAWCEMGKNYDGEIILSYNDETLVDGHWQAPAIYKVTFDGMTITDIKYIEIPNEK